MVNEGLKSFNVYSDAFTMKESNVTRNVDILWIVIVYYNCYGLPGISLG